MSSRILACYLLAIEVTLLMMGTRTLTILRSDPIIHPIEIVGTLVFLVLLRHRFGFRLPYNSFPVIFLLLSLIVKFYSTNVEFAHHEPIRWLSSVIMVPVYEELLYRVCVVELVERRLGRDICMPASILISSALFAFAHRSTVETGWDMFVCVLAGVAFIGRYLGSRKNLLEPLLIHCLHNAHAMLKSEETQAGVLVPVIFYICVGFVSIHQLVREKAYGS